MQYHNTPHFCARPRRIPTINAADGNSLLSYLDPQSVLNYVEDKLKARDPAFASFLNQLQCKQSILPIFTTETIQADGFLGSLAMGSCAVSTLACGMASCALLLRASIARQQLNSNFVSLCLLCGAECQVCPWQ